MVLVTEDVGEDGVTVVRALGVGDQAHGHAGHGALDRHARVHQRQRGAADRALGGGAVGGEDLGDHADGVGEVFHLRDDALQRLLYQSAVAVLAAAGAALGAGLTHGVGGHVVVMHEALLGLFPDGVQLLGVAQSGQGGDGKDLGLSAGEEAGAVHHGDHADFGGQRTDLVHLTAVHALAGQQPLLDDLLLQLVQDLLHVLHHIGVLVLVLLLDHGDPVVDAALTHVLVVGVHAVFHGRELVVHQQLEELLVEGGVLILELGLADLLDHLVDQVQHGLQMLVRLHDALVHDLIGDLVGLRLDHDDLLVGGGDGGGHAVGGLLGLGGVKEELFAVPAEDDAGNGAVERHVGDADRGGGADHGSDLGAAVPIHAQDLAGDDNVIAQVGGEKRTHGPVNEAGGQHGGQAGLALTAHEAAGDAAHGVELLVEVHGEGEVIDAVLGAGGGGAGHENGGLAVLHENGGVAELSHLAHFHGEGAAFIHHFILAVIGELFVGDDHL